MTHDPRRQLLAAVRDGNDADGVAHLLGALPDASQYQDVVRHNFCYAFREAVRCKNIGAARLLGKEV